MIPDADPDDVDIVQAVLQHVRELAPMVDEQVAAKVDQAVRAKYGGMRMRIPKRGKYLKPEQREAAYRDALTNMPTPEVLRKHKISLATLKRLVKKGPGG